MMTDETEWFDRFKAGTEAARRSPWGRVYSEHREAVYALARGFTGDASLAEDVIQETLLAVCAMRAASAETGACAGGS